MNDKTKHAETKPAKTKHAETKHADLWERTTAWADKDRTISGALVGGAAGRSCRGSGPRSAPSWARGLDLPHGRKRTCQLAAANLR